MRVRSIAVAFFYITLIYVGSVSGEEGKEQIEVNKQYQIVFTIFDKNSAGNYAYLRDSIKAMLASRLSARDNITVLEKTFTEKELLSLKKKNPQKGLSIGGETADYLVTGALFSLTSGLETQVDLYPFDPEKEVLHFSVISPTADTLFADVEQLSRDIAQTAFGDNPDVVGNETKNVAVGGNEAFVTANPEEAYKRNFYSGSSVGVAGDGVTTKGRGPLISSTIPGDMRAMSVGDVTGDGNKEILILSGEDLRLFSKIENVLEQVAQSPLPQNLVINAINTADIDGDGKEEIYISATDGLSVSSLIMTYDTSGGFQIAAQNIPLYLRPLLVPGKGWQLVGQKRGLERINLINSGVYLLTFDSQYKIANEQRMQLPINVNLFDFVYADLDGDGLFEVVVVDQQQKLRVYSPGNNLMWVSQKKFGSSKIYLGPSRGGAHSQVYNQRNFTELEDGERELIFVPGRIIVTDIDADGKEEIVISEDKDVGPGFLRYFNRLRFYDSGAVVSLAWTGSTLVESWRTGNFKGYVAGYDFTLLQEQPQQEKTTNDDVTQTIGRLFVGYLPESGSLAEILPGNGKTELTIYDLQFSKEKIKDKENSR